MQNSQNTILSDYQEKLAETFEHINYLIANDKIEKTIVDGETLIRLKH